MIDCDCFVLIVIVILRQMVLLEARCAARAGDSKLLRQLPTRSTAEKAANLRASLERAEAAVACDPSHAESWYGVRWWVCKLPWH